MCATSQQASAAVATRTATPSTRPLQMLCRLLRAQNSSFMIGLTCVFRRHTTQDLNSWSNRDCLRPPTPPVSTATSTRWAVSDFSASGDPGTAQFYCVRIRTIHRPSMPLRTWARSIRKSVVCCAIRKTYDFLLAARQALPSVLIIARTRPPPRPGVTPAGRREVVSHSSLLKGKSTCPFVVGPSLPI